MNYTSEVQQQHGGAIQKLQLSEVQKNISTKTSIKSVHVIQ